MTAEERAKELARKFSTVEFRSVPLHMERWEETVADAIRTAVAEERERCAAFVKDTGAFNGIGICNACSNALADALRSTPAPSEGSTPNDTDIVDALADASRWSVNDVRLSIKHELDEIDFHMVRDTFRRVCLARMSSPTEPESADE